jgi:hypothetical protein
MRILHEFIMALRRTIWKTAAGDAVDDPDAIPHVSDRLEWEPTSEEILKMTTADQIRFVQNARMKEGCRMDEWRNRARIRACYLINNAYEGVKDERQELELPS